MKKLKFTIRTGWALAVLCCAAVFASCELFGLKDQDDSTGGQVGDVTYYATRNLDKLMQLMNEGQSEERYGDTGTVIEWDIDFNYLISPTPKPTGDGTYPPYLNPTNITEYFSAGSPDPALWYKVELWGADGGNVNTGNWNNDPPDSTYTEEWLNTYWHEDHFEQDGTKRDLSSDTGKLEARADIDYGWGGKGGYIGAYLKVYTGQILYFFVGGKGKNGEVPPPGTVGVETIYGFNGGGKGSPAKGGKDLDGGGGGGATSLALNMAYFYAAKKVEMVEMQGDGEETILVEKETTENALDDKGNPIYKYDLTKGYAPGSSSPSDGLHYNSRLLVAGGGGGAGQGHNGNRVSLHGGDGNGGMGEAEYPTLNPATNSKVSPAGIVAKMDKTGALTDFSQATPKFQVKWQTATNEEVTLGTTITYDGFSNFSYISSAGRNRSLVLPGDGNGKGMNGGYSGLGGYSEGHGGGGGGWIGGGAIFNPAAIGDKSIDKSITNVNHAWYNKELPGYSSNNTFPTSAGNGGSNGAITLKGQKPTINGLTYAEAVPAGIDAVVMAHTYDFSKLSVEAGGRDPDTFRVKLAPTPGGEKPIFIKLIKNHVESGPGAGKLPDGSENDYKYTKNNMGSSGLQGLKEANDICKASGRTTMKGNGFIDVHLMKIADINTILGN